ncbi:inosine-uridine preferring nucleoside hydrolase [Arcicella aurantiaca]|uniref:Inosine-uridine preferring nucleoside hydrolase n=1 Tax=Arcicella aurantiaca TaxID=591202 RepID=A0A316EAL3_9BACT|nr:nucleoside hydrolase [Arcicella aurantiaca]PWK26379.1 inosine-uridine preferring nucleoside hydrolase [Arcicella aurantiaca]
MANKCKVILYLGFFFLIAPALQGQTLNSPVSFSPRMRIIIDNDLSGDPDGLFQVAHTLLSPSVEVRAIIGSHLRVNDPFDNSEKQAENAAAKANEMIQLLGIKTPIPVFAGSNKAMINDTTPVKNSAVDFIIKEALRTDTKAPLYVVCGAGLTEIASALLTNPQIANKLTLVWIGGPEYTDLAVPPPGYSHIEYNLNIDISAARAVFNRSNVPIWQIPRNAYRQCLMTHAQMLVKVKPKGKIGEYLFGQIASLLGKFQKYGLLPAESYVVGDSPLVLLTALQAQFEPDASSSDYAVKQAPIISEDGQYVYNHKGRMIRVYTRLDTYLMFDDLFTKLELVAH